MNVFDQIKQNISAGKKMLAVLVDPDKYSDFALFCLAEILAKNSPDFVFVGGSLVTASAEKTTAFLKSHTQVPVVLFPGNVSQLVPNADAVLLLTLISGRNPDFLIGQQVVAAPQIRQMGLEPISVGYMLIDGGCVSSVEYMSGTRPIPHDKDEIAAATALAGEMLGCKMIYLEAGSGAMRHISAQMIRHVRAQVSVPLVVGGGLRSASDVREVLSAGADMVVVGNVLEKEVSLLPSLLAVVRGGIF